MPHLSVNYSPSLCLVSKWNVKNIKKKNKWLNQMVEQLRSERMHSEYKQSHCHFLSYSSHVISNTHTPHKNKLFWRRSILLMCQSWHLKTSLTLRLGQGTDFKMSFDVELRERTRERETVRDYWVSEYTARSGAELDMAQILNKNSVCHSFWEWNEQFRQQSKCESISVCVLSWTLSCLDCLTYLCPV